MKLCVSFKTFWFFAKQNRTLTGLQSIFNHKIDFMIKLQISTTLKNIKHTSRMTRIHTKWIIVKQSHLQTKLSDRRHQRYLKKK